MNDGEIFILFSSCLTHLFSYPPPLQIKAHRHAVGRELYARLDEARINLRRFLEYKQPQF